MVTWASGGSCDSVSMTRGVPMNPPSGMPPPNALATTNKSGVASQCSHANGAPVRPKPVTTSSNTSSAPTSEQRRRSPGRKPSSGMRTPASACIGSTITAATDSSMRSSVAESLNGSNVTSGSNGANGCRYTGLPPTDTAPKVSPWKLPANPTSPGRPVYLRAVLRAPSTASVPLFVK